MNIPNGLTLLRIFFVPLLVALLVTDKREFAVGGFSSPTEYVALGIFLCAAATDLLDGYLARRWKQITTVGTLLDPIADKLLISAALISLVQVSMLPAWMAILVVGREFAVSGLRSIAAASGYTIKASDLGKTKMLTQVAAISLVLWSIHNHAVLPYAMAVMWMVVFFGVASAIGYFLKFWDKVDQEIKTRRRQELIVLERQRRRRARAATRKEASVGGHPQ